MINPYLLVRTSNGVWYRTGTLNFWPVGTEVVIYVSTQATFMKHPINTGTPVDPEMLTFANLTAIQINE